MLRSIGKQSDVSVIMCLTMAFNYRILQRDKKICSGVLVNRLWILMR